jgi:formate hydrogenlyase transcriptional activator
MESATQSPPNVQSRGSVAEDVSKLFSSEAVLNLQKLIFAGSPLPEVLAIIARLVESQANGMLCTIWLPDEDETELYCAAAPGLPGFSAHVGRMAIGPKGGSCGTAIYRRAPVFEDRVEHGICCCAYGFRRSDPGRDGHRQRTGCACDT